MPVLLPVRPDTSKLEITYRSLNVSSVAIRNVMRQAINSRYVTGQCAQYKASTNLIPTYSSYGTAWVRKRGTGLQVKAVKALHIQSRMSLLNFSMKHNRSLKVAVQGPDFGPPLIYTYIISVLPSDGCKTFKPEENSTTKIHINLFKLRFNVYL
jgi:hypothetical protein